MMIKGYEARTVERIWRLEGLSCMEDLFALTDKQILSIPGVGRKTLDLLRRLQREGANG
jgi:hypothetical protein